MKRPYQKEARIREVIDFIRDHPKGEDVTPTDDDIRDFIRMFMTPDPHMNGNYSCNGIAKIAGRIIGRFFYGGRECTVPVERFKDIMKTMDFEITRAEYYPEIEYYSYIWDKDTKDFFNAYNYVK